MIYESRTELVTALGIMGPYTDLWYTVYAVSVPNVKAGDEFLVIGEIEAANEAYPCVEFMCALYASPNADLPVYNYNGTLPSLISPLNAHDVTSAEHYGNPHHSVMWHCPTDAEFVNFGYRARCKYIYGSGDQNMNVRPGQGMIQVRKF